MTDTKSDYRARLRAENPVRFASPVNPAGLNWVPLGPISVLEGPGATKPVVSGSVSSLAVTPGGDVVYVGSVNGGVWRSDDGGESFYPLMNALDFHPTSGLSDSLAVGALAVPLSSPNRIYVGSGEALTPESVTGVGPIVSDDGGLNWYAEPWTPPNPAQGSVFYGLAVDPADPEIAIGASDQGLFRRQPRNQDVEGLPPDKPQNYLLTYGTATGAAEIDYWDPSGLAKTAAWAPGGTPWGPAAATTQLVPYTLGRKPYFLRYVSAAGGNNVWLYEIQGSAAPAQRANVAFGANLLLLMPFELGGVQYLIKYDTTILGVNVNTMLVRWNPTTNDFVNVWPAQVSWAAGWTALVPFVLGGVPCFFKYNTLAGNTTQLCRWSGNLIAAQVGANLNLPNGAQLVPVELEGEMWLMVYEPANVVVAGFGVTTLYHILPSGALSAAIWVNNALIPAGAVLVPFAWEGMAADEPRFYAYVAGTGVTSLFAFGPNRTPVMLARWTWAQNTIFMPFLMGYEWADKQAKIKPEPRCYHAPTRALVPNRRASSVVSATDGDATVMYAAFWADRIAGGGVSDKLKDMSQVYLSRDAGETWSQLGFFPSNPGFIRLAVQPSNIFVVYALTETGEVYRFERERGAELSRWSRVEGAPPAGDWIDVNERARPTIAVDPDDVMCLYLGGNKGVFAVAGRRTGESGALYRCVVTREGFGYRMTPTYIGASIPLGVNAISFTASRRDLWVGTALGVFHADDPDDTEPGAVDTMFEPKSAGLATTLAQSAGQHPTYDAILFSANQDGGVQRYAGDEVWRDLASAEDSGFALVSPNGQIVLASGQRTALYRSIDRGMPGTFQQVERRIVLSGGDTVRLYAPLVKSDTTRVVFGTKKPWFSDDFGGTWQSIPNNNDTDALPAVICAMGISPSGKRLYVALENGEIWKYTDTGRVGNPSWRKRRAIQAEGPAPLSAFMAASPGLTITDIVVDPADAEGYSLYVSLGGVSAAADGWKRVWRFVNPGGDVGGAWSQVSGPNGGPVSDQLMNVSFNALTAFRPAGATFLFAGADVGAWYSLNGGAQWAPYGEGLPEAAITDLAVMPPSDDLHRPALIRASLYGRGVYERSLSAAVGGNTRNFANPVQLYVRANVLDRGLYDVQNNVPDPTAQDPAAVVHTNDGIDVKVSRLDDQGVFPKPAAISPVEFQLLANASGELRANQPARVYVQIHNRGVVPANGVTVMVLLAASPAPALPGGFEASVQSATPINGGGWTTISIAAIDGLRVGFPQVISADIPGALLAPAGNFTIVALASAPQDLFTNVTVNVTNLVTAESKAVMKVLTVA